MRQCAIMGPLRAFFKKSGAFFSPSDTIPANFTAILGKTTLFIKSIQNNAFYCNITVVFCRDDKCPAIMAPFHIFSPSPIHRAMKYHSHTIHRAFPSRRRPHLPLLCPVFDESFALPQSFFSSLKGSCSCYWIYHDEKTYQKMPNSVLHANQTSYIV